MSDKIDRYESKINGSQGNINIIYVLFSNAFCFFRCLILNYYIISFTNMFVKILLHMPLSSLGLLE